MSHARAAALMVAATVLWSTAGVVTRSLESAQGVEVAFWRSFFAALSMAGIIAYRHRGNAWSVVRATGWPGLLSGLMFSIMFTCFMVAVMSTTVANALVVNSLYPAFAALLAMLVLRTRLPPHTWVAIALATAGMAFMFASGLGAGLRGTLIAFAVPVAASINVVTLKKFGRDVDLAPAVLVGGALSALATLPLALPLRASAYDVVVLAALGMFQLALPCILLVIAARRLPAAEVALLTLLEAVLGTLWTWLGAGEVPGSATLAGGGVVLAAIAGNEFIALYGRARLRRLPAA